MKPNIGITCKKRELSIQNYIDAVIEFGGEPILFAALEKTTARHLDSIPEYLEQIHGLLLPGGGDIDPGRYSQERHESVRGVSRSRDALEIRLFQKALEANIPVFGICRGIQVMSVATGGNLIQDIPSLYPEEPLNHKKVNGEDSLHDIGIVPHSRLSEIVIENHATVNSAHHQAVDRVGDGFVVTARTEAGLIEAIEIPYRRFVIGVQSHPERMGKENRLCNHSENLFKAFINASFQ